MGLVNVTEGSTIAVVISAIKASGIDGQAAKSVTDAHARTTRLGHHHSRISTAPNALAVAVAAASNNGARPKCRRRGTEVTTAIALSRNRGLQAAVEDIATERFRAVCQHRPW
jgi:hypothetical protein